MAPKDQDAIQKKSGVIYRYQCDRVECDEEYIGESSRTFGDRFKEHLKAPSPIYDHQNITGHNVTLDNFSIVWREDQNLCRWIKEALYIRINNPSLNKNIGKYHLPHIWDEVLHNTSELKTKINTHIHLPLGTTSTRRDTLTPCSGHSICHCTITSAITTTKSGYSICHRAITSAHKTKKIISNKWLFHLPQALTSVYQ